MTTRRAVAAGWQVCPTCYGWGRLEDSPGMDHTCPDCRGVCVRRCATEHCGGWVRKGAVDLCDVCGGNRAA